MNTSYDFEAWKLETRLDQQIREWVRSENVERTTSLYGLCEDSKKIRKAESSRHNVWAWLAKHWRKENHEKIYRISM